jgi:hypothetical protein
MKSEPVAKKITVFITADSNSIFTYFNPHDPSPIYSRQLSQEFEKYLNNCIVKANRYSIINYKVVCLSKIDSLFTGPLMEAIRRHYTIKRALKEKEFKKFKRRSYYLLALGLAVVMTCQGLLPYIFSQEHRVHSALSNALDVFSWVVLWKPIERLIFYWNPFLKDICLLDKMINAEATVIENEKSRTVYSVGREQVANP